MAISNPSTGIPIIIPGFPTQIIPIPANGPALTEEQIAALQQQITGQILTGYPGAVTDLKAALMSGDFTKFNADVTKVVEQILNDFENLYPPPCFTSGTLIRINHGDVPVQNLAVGDLVVTSTGSSQPIKWIGHRTVDCRRHPRPNEVMPVRIAANAFAENRPARDLLLSPGHAVCVDIVGEVLIPASSLVNGVSITREEADQITYWHVELEGGHDVIMAENMPTESYMEMGNRAFFADGELVSLVGLPDAPITTHADFCRPFHANGPLVDIVQTQLLARVDRLGGHHEHMDIATCRLVVDGVAIEPKRRDMSLLFKVPAGASDVWLVSSVGIPAALSTKSRDYRSLGLQVAGISISDGYSTVSVKLDDPRLAVGFHKVEVNGETIRRWTDGHAYLPSVLWEGMEDDLFVRVDLGSQLLPRWVKSTHSKSHLALAA